MAVAVETIPRGISIKNELIPVCPGRFRGETCSISPVRFAFSYIAGESNFCDSSVIAARIKHSIIPDKIVNMDQTMVRFDMPCRRTNELKGKKTVRIKTSRAEKKGFTVALASTAAGDKLPAFLIFKERSGQLGQRVRRNLIYPGNVRVFASTNGWMTRELFHTWLRTVYKSHQQRKLLILDEYRPHKADDSRKIASEECNSEIVLIPGGCTSIAQPMDRSVNKPFKESIRESWSSWMRQNGGGKTPAGNLKQPTRQNVIDWVAEAWRKISPELLVKSLLVCGISNALDGSEDDLLSDDLPRLNEEDEGGNESDEEDSPSDSDDDDDLSSFGDEEDDD